MKIEQLIDSLAKELEVPENVNNYDFYEELLNIQQMAEYGYDKHSVIEYGLHIMSRYGISSNSMQYNYELFDVAQKQINRELQRELRYKLR